MRKPLFETGQFVIHIPSKKEYFIKSVNFKTYPVVKNGRTTGVEDEFTGFYYCSWLDDKGKTVSGNVEETLLSKPS